MFNRFQPRRELGNNLHSYAGSVLHSLPDRIAGGSALTAQVLPKADIGLAGLAYINGSVGILPSKEVNAVSRHCDKITAN